MVECPKCHRHEGVWVDFHTAEQSETDNEICTLAECVCGCEFHITWGFQKVRRMVKSVKHKRDITNTCYVCGKDYLDNDVSIIDGKGAICLNCQG